MKKTQRNNASFRDPNGYVYQIEDRIYRTVMPVAQNEFDFVRSTGLITKLIAEKKLLPETLIESHLLKDISPDIKCVLEHPKLPFISYPYEWTFSALKSAALLHIDIHLQALEHGVTLSDASAFNIQFQGSKPVFIDHLSFRKYQEGEIWNGHRQFCEQFLNPLLLQSYCHMPYNVWYRSALEGISADQLVPLLPFYRKCFPNIFLHVVMQSSLQKTSTKQAVKTIKKIHLPLSAFKKLLSSLRRWIEKLQLNNNEKSSWQDYSSDYLPLPKKIAFVKEFIETTRPRLLWDMGCNTGFYSKLALQTGAKKVIGFDADQGAVEKAFSMAVQEQLNFLPLLMDLANPSPDQGWQNAERMGMMTRAPADALLALAVTHHLAITRNIPLSSIIDCLLNLAPEGLIEFVPKHDPQLQRLLSLRKDIFEDYSEEIFLNAIQQKATIVKKEIVSDSERLMVWYKRDKNNANLD